jgi:hypothetical protein
VISETQPVTDLHDRGRSMASCYARVTLRGSISNDEPRVYLARGAREVLTKLDPSRREALRDGFSRVGLQLLSSAERARVEPGWARGTWPRRRYPQQCYAKTVKYVLDHPEIKGARLVHGVVSHAPHFVPLDHAWIELPGDIVFDGVVQTFFTRSSYYSVMTAAVLDVYSATATRRLVTARGGPGPWNAKWVPTAKQLDVYALTVRTRQESRAASPLLVNLGRNR